MISGGIPEVLFRIVPLTSRMRSAVSRIDEAPAVRAEPGLLTNIDIGDRYMATDDITPERLREWLNYDPKTGIFTWRIRKSYRIQVGQAAGHIAEDGYVTIRVNGRSLKAHRIAWLFVTGEWPREEVGHKNWVLSDNRFENLEPRTRAEVMQSQRSAHKENATELLGVSQFGKGFRSQIKVDGNTIYLGYFRTAEEAHSAYINAKRKLHAGCTT
jgi:hypothetical protein